jgi:hypothetical protein
LWVVTVGLLAACSGDDTGPHTVLETAPFSVLGAALVAAAWSATDVLTGRGVIHRTDKFILPAP